MQPTQELIDRIYRDRVLRARKMTMDQKFVAGPQLFARSCQLMMDGIRHQFPGSDDARVRQILAERLALVRRLENGDDGR